jgi:hypothetical protein
MTLYPSGAYATRQIDRIVSRSDVIRAVCDTDDVFGGA